MQKLLTIYHHIKNDSLYRNSVFLLINTVILAFFGFFFWAICTRVFSTEDIGIATTLISSVDLVAVFALLGLNVSVIRYLPKSENKNSTINSVLITVGITAIIGSIIYVIGINRFAPELSFIKSNKIFIFAFGLFVVFTCWSQILKNIFRAYLSTEYVVLKNSIFNILKIGFIFVFISLGAFGILTSWMTALTIAVLISIIILIHTFGYRPNLTIDVDSIKHMATFSFANYLAEFFERAPRLMLPIIITATINSEETAYYYINMSLATFIFMIPEAISGSFFAEGSKDETSLTVNTKKVIKALTVTLLPAIIFTVFLGNYVLLFFGKEYSTEGFRFLQILTISGLPAAINTVSGNILRIQHRIKSLVLVVLVGSVATIGFTYGLIDLALTGVGIAWLAGQITMSILYLFTIWRYTSS